MRDICHVARVNWNDGPFAICKWISRNVIFLGGQRHRPLIRLAFCAFDSNYYSYHSEAMIMMTFDFIHCKCYSRTVFERRSFIVVVVKWRRPFIVCKYLNTERWHNIGNFLLIRNKRFNCRLVHSRTWSFGQQLNV